MCLLNENVSIEQKYAYWMKRCLLTENMPIEWKSAYWPNMCLLNENVPIDRKIHIDKKCVYWKMKRYNYSVFLNVYVSLIYVAMWHNEEWSIKVKHFAFILY